MQIDDAERAPETRMVPVVHKGVIFLNVEPEGLDVRVNGVRRAIFSFGFRQIALESPLAVDAEVSISKHGAQIDGATVNVQVGDWSGAVNWACGGLVSGHARNLRDSKQDVPVLAFNPRQGIIAVATARAAEDGAFLMVLPPAINCEDRTVQLGIWGSDYLLEEGLLERPYENSAKLSLVSRPVAGRVIRVKISTPNMKEAQAWGDYHFAKSLQSAFARLGHQMDVDTADVWYDHQQDEDVVIVLRGRHRFKTQAHKINIMWLISHPDRIPHEEFADYDHVAVASDFYAAELKRRGVPSVSVLHQAADRDLFGARFDLERKASCLFVGNSRREYRTMVKWCLQSKIPVELYGGGWEGIVPKELVRATNIANVDLPNYYASHLVLLNDHWDSMRENGFISNRIFDGSAAATPIITDAVVGLHEVFGDSIVSANDIDQFKEIVFDCLANPKPYLERAAEARKIVLSKHTFDDRARQLDELIEAIANRK